MRALSSILGIFLSAPALLFFWIGSQTFIRPYERVLANVLTLATGILLVLSIVLIFNPAVQRVQSVLLIGTVALLAATLFLARMGG